MNTTAALGDPIGGSSSTAGAGGGASGFAAAVAVEQDGTFASSLVCPPIGPARKANQILQYVAQSLQVPSSPSPPNRGSHLNASNP